jgi:hypothetical protein
MNKNSNIILKIFLFVVVFYLLLNTFLEYFVFQNNETVIENVRSLYILDFWNLINFGFLNSKFFFSFVLVFPLLVSLGYLLLYVSLKFFGFEYKNFYYIKEFTIFFGFLYFFFFILILIDFIYYIEIHKLYFNVTEEELRLLLKKK